MAQHRIHDYRAPRSSEDLNAKLTHLMPPGVYRGFHVGADGSIAAGLLLTPEGVSVEEDTPVAVAVPAGDPTHPRLDRVVCRYEYVRTVPPSVATYEVVSGEPAASPEAPDLPDHAVLLATCRMNANGTTWTTVTQAYSPERLINAVHHLDGRYTIVHGARGAYRELFDPNTGRLFIHVVRPGTLADGATIAWNDPILCLGPDGIDQVTVVINAVNNEISARQAADNLKLDKAGGTLTGNLNVGNGGTGVSPEVRFKTSGTDARVRAAESGNLELEALGAGKHVVLRPGTGGQVVLQGPAYCDTGALHLGDDNGADVDLSSDTATAIDPALPQSILGALNVIREHSLGMTYPLWHSLLNGGNVQVGGDLTVQVNQSRYLVMGRFVVKDATNVVVPDNATRYLYFQGSTGTYQLATAVPLPVQDDIPIARLTTSGGNVTAKVELGMALARIGRRGPILVGPAGAPGVQCHSLADAVALVGELTTPAAGSGDGRSYPILLVGEVTEDAAALPIKIPVDGMVIEAAAGPNAVKWGGDVALLDLNGKDRVVVRDVALTYTTTTPAPDSQARVAVVNTGGVSDRCTLSNLRLTGGVASGFLRVDGSNKLENSLVEHCQANDIADFGIYLANANGTRIVGCRMLQHVAGAGPSALGTQKAGIKLGNAEGAVVDACRVEGFEKEGIYLGEATDGAVRCKVVHNAVKDVEGSGIYLTFEAERCAVHGNTVENAGNAVMAYGIYVEGDRNLVEGNDLVPHDQVPPPTAQAAIRLGGQADFCIVTGNQTNGFGVSVSDGANNTVEHNRDDS
jgi:hypothetical protein